MDLQQKHGFLSTKRGKSVIVLRSLGALLRASFFSFSSSLSSSSLSFFFFFSSQQAIQLPWHLPLHAVPCTQQVLKHFQIVFQNHLLLLFFLLFLFLFLFLLFLTGKNAKPPLEWPSLSLSRMARFFKAPWHLKQNHLRFRHHACPEQPHIVTWSPRPMVSWRDSCHFSDQSWSQHDDKNHENPRVPHPNPSPKKYDPNTCKLWYP